MDHDIEWNAAIKAWPCVRCLRTSDHQAKEDAEFELSQHDRRSSANRREQDHPESGRGSSRESFFLLD